MADIDFHKQKSYQRSSSLSVSNGVNRIIPLAISAIVWFLLEQLLGSPKQILWLVLLGVVAIVLGIWQLTGRRLTHEKFWRFIITPVFFLASSVMLLSFLQGPMLKQFFVLMIAVFLFIYHETLFIWLHRRPKYQAHSLENISVHINLLTIFLLSAGVFGIEIFLGAALWQVLTVFIFVCGLLTYQLIWTSGAGSRPGWIYVAVITLVTTELFLAVSFLSTSIYVNGFIVATGYYITSGLSRNWLIGIRERQVVKRYSIISILSLIIVLLTAKWL